MIQKVMWQLTSNNAKRSDNICGISWLSILSKTVHFYTRRSTHHSEHVVCGSKLRGRARDDRSLFLSFCLSLNLILSKTRNIPNMSSNYFNNHSQSRFMPLSNSRDSASNKSSSPGGTSSSSTHQPPSRVPSKHFSSSLTNSQESKTGLGGKGSGMGPTSLHPLRNTSVAGPFLIQEF
jgi:hypothetical protein